MDDEVRMPYTWEDVGASQEYRHLAPPKTSMLPPGSARVSGRASALLGVAGHSLAVHRLLLGGSPTYLLPVHMLST